jgi:hypothetical protein
MNETKARLVLRGPHDREQMRERLGVHSIPEFPAGGTDIEN